MSEAATGRKIEDIYPLSPMQEGMLFHTLYAPELREHINQLSWTISGGLDVEAFAKTWQRVIERHQVLRSSFYWEGLDHPLQVVSKEAKLPLAHLDWSDQSTEQQRERLNELLQEERERGFELNQAPLLRLILIRSTADSYHFVWTTHHLLLDGWSMPLLVKEILDFYAAFSHGRDVHLERCRPFADYILWLQGQEMSSAEAFWRGMLRNFREPISLSVEKNGADSSPQDSSPGQHSLTLSVEATAAIQSFARRHQLTVNTLFQGAWAILLSRYSGKKDVVFGAVVSGRPGELPDAETMVGNFINTLPVRVQVEPTEPVHSWLKRLQERQVEARQYEYSPLYEIQGWSEVPRGVSLFEHILVFQNFPVGEILNEQSQSLSVTNFRTYDRVNYQMTVKAVQGRALQLILLYSRQHYDDETGRRLLDHLRNAMESLVVEPEQPLSRVEVLGPEEREQLLIRCNETASEFPRHLCIHDIFQQQVERTPDLPALIYEGGQLTYGELEARANQLAHYLRSLGVGPEDLVALCCEPAPEMLIALLAILKAGAGYLPLEQSHPPQRLSFILTDASVKVLLTQRHLLKRLPFHSAEVIVLDELDEILSGYSTAAPKSTVSPDNLIYVIYTSGSTGEPKGAMNTHRGIVNCVHWMQQTYQLDSSDRFLARTSLTFDPSVWELLWPLTVGATVVLARAGAQADSAYLLETIARQQITTVYLIPSLLGVFVEEPRVTELGGSVRRVICGGEALPFETMERFFECLPEAELHHSYGPTETSIAATEWLCQRTQTDGGRRSVLMGFPLANTEVYVLDDDLRAVPAGVVGELYIGGTGVGRGYYGREQLTAERFIPHSFSRRAGARLYRSGDLVRYEAEGGLQFVGRVDEQVKLRGYRIELGEIEAAARRLDGVREAVAAVQESETGEKLLVCYVVLAQAEVGSGAEQGAPESNQWREALSEQLPDYMVPQVWLVLEQLPLTPNGKVNRRALPAVELQSRSAARSFVAPRTAVEEVIAGLWCDVLHLERLSIHDNFFELGGHSLIATRVISRLREAFRLEVPLRGLFENPTIAALALMIEVELRQQAGGAAVPALHRISREQPLPLSFAQQRLWILDQLEPGSAAYNIPAAFAVKGRLDVAALEQTIDEIIKRHESLRTTFQSREGKPLQSITEVESFSLAVKDLRHLPEAERQLEARRLAGQEARTGFDLERGPLLRVRLLLLGEDEHVVLLTMHHIISDGWSIGVLMGEVATLYQAISGGESFSLPELPIQYADYAYWQREWLSGAVLDAQLDFWRKQLEDAPVLQLPADHPRPVLQTSSGAAQRLALTKELTQALQALSRREGVTLFMTLLAACQVLLSRYTGQDDIVVGTVIANRNRAETEGLLGFFINNLALRTKLSSQMSFRDLLRQVREVTLEAYTHQDVPFELVLEALQIERDLSRTPIFQVLFALQNTPAATQQISDLQLTRHEIATNTARFDLEFYLAEGAPGLGGYLVYNTDLFESSTISRMLIHFQNLLASIVAEPDQRVIALPLLSDEERWQLLVEWNQTEMVRPSVSLQQLLEEQVASTPENIAVVCDLEKLTYRELNHRANQVAHFLLDQGIAADSIVPLLAERGIELLIAILGVLKAGGAYLPLDPRYPTQRLTQALEGNDFKVVLVTQEFIPVLNQALEQLAAEQRPPVACIGELLEQARPVANLPVRSRPGDLAYVIYTSGSTGTPKGAMIEHAGMLNHMFVMNEVLALSDRDAVAQTASQCFDISVWQFLSVLLVGGRVEIIPREVVRDPALLLERLLQGRLTVLEIVPALLQALIEEMKRAEPGRREPLALRWLIPTGEVLTSSLCRQWLSLYPAVPMLNAYGPTECSDDVSLYALHEPPGDDLARIPIGRPIANTRLYILDQEREPVPIGITGELYIGGMGVGRGYLNDPQRTAEVFLYDKFARQAGGRLYKTGDLARFLPEGDIEFLGRNDDQVKVRGYRIELGEIETVLNRHAGVQQAVVLVLDEANGQKRIVAYLVPRPSSYPTVEELLTHLKASLPEYMLPAAFVMLDQLPLTANGKINRRLLPVPDQVRPESESLYVAPRNAMEERLANIYEEVLGLEHVGIHDNFFQIGGHSLLATQVVSRLRTTFQLDFPLRRIFEQPTIAGLSIAIIESQADRAGADEMAQLMTELDSLSEDEVQRLLEEQLDLDEDVNLAEVGRVAEL